MKNEKNKLKNTIKRISPRVKKSIAVIKKSQVSFFKFFILHSSFFTCPPVRRYIDGSYEVETLTIINRRNAQWT